MTQKYYAVINMTAVNHYEEDIYKLVKPVNTVWSSLDSAIASATNQASKTPGQQYAVMEVVTVFEALAPAVITKKFNDEGELLNV